MITKNINGVIEEMTREEYLGKKERGMRLEEVKIIKKIAKKKRVKKNKDLAKKINDTKNK
ncbi:MAG TPA: hypothetical protein ENL05_01065 [Candidatus Moranbacteria bacterium]|nr:hypothetical protein [Candidatus Moranbacteria bacterium]